MPADAKLLNFKQFAKTSFEFRTKSILVNDESGQAAKVVCKNLTANQLYLAYESSSYIETKKAIIAGLAADSNITDAIKSLVGLDNELTKELVTDLAFAEFGIAEPVFEYAELVYFATHRPADFRVLVNTIKQLTAAGSEKKPVRSSKTPA